MAVRTNCPYTGSIGIVDGLLVFLINGVAHFVTGNAEFKGVGRLHRGIESTPENYPANESNKQ
jgi:hypothetical protein